MSLASARASDKARIQANYLGDAGGFDLRMMVECAKLSRELLAQRAFDAYRGAPIFPARTDLSDAELVEFIRAKAETVYHPVGTCRMGSDHDAVASFVADALPKLKAHLTATQAVQQGRPPTPGR